MKIPDGFTEEKVCEIIERALLGLCSKFRFGYYEKEDMEQEGWIFAIEALESYSEDRGVLEHFLRVMIRNRFINLKRNKFSRYEPPCISCPFYDPDLKYSTNKCSEFLNKDDCDKWAAWKKRNAAKTGLIRPLDLDSVTEDDIASEEFLSSINLSSILKKIDQNLPMELRSDFLKMLDGITIPKQKKEKVRQCLADMGIRDDLKDWEDK